jgi:hypothetical protein
MRKEILFVEQRGGKSKHFEGDVEGFKIRP